jgi:hypothetical protein
MQKGKLLQIDYALSKVGFSAIGKSFRGSIVENCKRFRLEGPGYASMPPDQNGHFDIATARHLDGPLRALLDPNVRQDYVIGATQVMKSVCGDIWLPYIAEHQPRPTLVLFEDDGKAQLFCEARLMATLRAHSAIARMISEIDRHDATKTRIKLATMLLQICGLNDGNVSSLSWPNIWVSEAWQHDDDELLSKALKRMDRYPSSCKALIESQAGRESQPGKKGGSLHLHAKAAHWVSCTWACPECGGRQSWECDREYSKLRPDDFEPKDNGKNPPPKPATFAGMMFKKEGTIDERAETAEWECFHCGYHIKDTPMMRQRLMDSYQQDYQITGPNGLKISPKYVCFILPRECATGNTFASGVRSYLMAKDAERMGNREPLNAWYMSERAIFPGPKLYTVPVSVITGSAAIEIPNEAARVLGVDCQQGDIPGKTGKFWYAARAIDREGKTLHQLARGYAESWKEWIDVQKRLKIPNDNVGIDGGHFLHEVLDAAAANFEIVTRLDSRTKKPFKARAVWKVLVGNGQRKSFPHDGGQFRAFSKPGYYQRGIQVAKGQFATLNIAVYNWSNLSVKDHLYNLVRGGGNLPKFLALERESLPTAVQEKEMGDLTYTKQMQNQYRTTKNGKDFYEETSPNVHYPDCECECVVLLDMGGLLGLPAAMEDAAVTD